MAGTDTWQTLPVRPLNELLCRAVRDAYAPLDVTGSLLAGGRFNPRGVAALYLAPTPDLALRESTGTLSWSDLAPFAPRRIVCVAVRLSRIADLRSERAPAALGFEPAALLADWDDLRAPAPTQHLGHTAFVDGLEGLLFPSRIDPSASNLVVFRDNLLADSRLEVVERE